MSKTKITILLIKKDTPFNGVIKKDTPKQSLADGNYLYYKATPLACPKWVDSFFLNAIPHKEWLMSNSASSVVLYKVAVADGEERIFAICFGYGRNLVVQNVIERRFGLLVTLNCVKGRSLRSVDTTTLDTITRNNRIQSSALSVMENFNIDTDKNLLKTITGISSNESISGTLVGADSLSVTTEKKYNDMDSFLKKCYSLFVSKDYQSEYGWVDKMCFVKDTSLVKDLDDRVLEQLNSNNPNDVWISLPEIVDYGSIDSFKLEARDSHSDIDIITIKSDFGRTFTKENIKRLQVSCLDSNCQTIRKWTLYRCIYADIAFNGKQYFLDNGKWYEVDQTFANNVNNFYRNVNLYRGNIPLSDFGCKVEKEYNKNVVEKSGEKFCLMDCNDIYYEGQLIEFCDIYTNDKQLIHVKRYKGSSTLSHLFSQGLVSAQNFLNKDFRTKVNEKLPVGFKITGLDAINPSEYTVVYAIARKNTATGSRPEIPFFSKVVFQNVASTLRGFGYAVCLCGINYTYNAKG